MNRHSRTIWLSVVGLVLIGLVGGGPIIVKHLSRRTAKMKLDAMVQRDLPLGSPRAKVVDYVTAQRWEVYPEPGQVGARIRGAENTIVCRIDVQMNFRFDSEGDLSSYSSDEFSICL
ncbi:MAG TPA: hypothetical protein VFF95_05350 [Candidatus Binatus sp.]|jgi:hypothetical protein|nr:hypothetical protein [Candidatus Binatus sp.]